LEGKKELGEDYWVKTPEERKERGKDRAAKRKNSFDNALVLRRILWSLRSEEKILGKEEGPLTLRRRVYTGFEEKKNDEKRVWGDAKVGGQAVSKPEKSKGLEKGGAGSDRGNYHGVSAQGEGGNYG